MRVSDILDRKGSSVVTVHTSDSVLDTATGFRARNIGAARRITQCSSNGCMTCLPTMGWHYCILLAE